VRVARRYVITGRVQGVGFRHFTASAAARSGVDGWVRNLPDGRVEIAAEGDAEAISRFDRQIRQGPAGARVDDVEVSDRPAGQARGFTIK
jgi:acylphosphatase